MKIHSPNLGQVAVVNPALPIEKPARTFTHDGLNWALANSRVGENTTNYLLVGGVCELLKNYFHAFINEDGSNIFVKLITNAFGAVADFFQGIRDREMYNSVYATGVNQTNGSKLDHDILTDPLLLQQANPIADDYEENSTCFKDDSVIHKLWVLSTKSANLKPFMYPFFPLLGTRLANIGKIVLDSVAKILWRARFLNNGLYSNASRDLYELSTSLFSSSAKEKKIKELESLAKSYFENSNISDEEKSSYLRRSGVLLYFSMLRHMLGRHFHGIRNPELALKEKCDRDYFFETNEIERKHNPSRTFSRGFIDPASKDDRYFQRIASIADFIGPVSGTLGIGITFVFDTLKGVIELAGINFGKQVVDAVASSKKGLSMIYYFFKIMLPELTQSNYKTLVKIEKPQEEVKDSESPETPQDDYEKSMEELVKNGEATEATKLLYTLRKDRWRNAIVMILTGLVNIVEPFLYMGSSAGRGLNFMKGVFYDLGTTFLLLGFSKRRECMGKIRYLQTVVADVLGKKNWDQVVVADFQKVDDEQFRHAMRNKAYLHPEREKPGILKRVSDGVRSVKNIFGYGNGISLPGGMAV